MPEEKGLVIHAWCIMPSRLHMIISSEKDPLANIMRDFKRHTASMIVKAIQEIPESRKEWLIRAFQKAGKDLKRISKYKVWQDGNHPEQVLTNHFLEQKLEYIHRNPVEAGIVEEAEHYFLSSARDYVGDRGLLEVQLLE